MKGSNFMLYDVIKVRYVKDYVLEIVFEDGKKGRVDLRDYANEGGIFGKLADLKYFKKVYVNKNIGTICWPNGADIAPETLYSLVSGKQPAREMA